MNKKWVRNLKVIIICLWLAITFYYGLFLWISLQSVGWNQTLVTINKLSDKLSWDNSYLEAQIAEQSSLRVIKQQGESQGFTSSKYLFIR